MEQYQHLITAFNWQNPSWDLFILLGWVVVSLIYAFTAGRGRIINILMSVYVAKLLTIEAPFLGNTLNKSLPENLLALQQLLTFLILFLMLFFLLGRFAFRTSVDGRQFSSMIFGIFFSFLQIGLLINIILVYLPQKIQTGLSPLVQTLFVNSPAGFVWLLVPLVFLIIFGRHVASVHEL